MRTTTVKASNRFLALLLSALLAVSFLPAAALSALADDEGEGGTVAHDLSPYIQSLTVVGDPATVADGDNVTISFSWLIDGEVHGGTDVFTYQLPANFAMEADSTGPVSKGKGGETIGTYTVNTSGLVTISYNDSYNTNRQTTANTMEITGVAKYIVDGEDQYIRFVWANGSTTVEVTNPGDFTVKKTAVKLYHNGLTSNTSVVRSTVTIQSRLGTNEPFTITDKFAAVQFLDADTFAYNAASFTLVDGNGVSYPVFPVISGNTFTITNVPALPAGGKYTLTYDINVQQSDNLSETYASIVNLVSVTSGVTKSDSVTVKYDKVIRKYSVEYINASQTQRWQVQIYTNGTNLAGYTLTDTANMPIAYEEKNGVKTPRIELVAYDTSGTQVAKYDSSIFTFSDSDKTFSFTFPDVSNIRYWAITAYSAVEGDAGTSFTATNTATVTTPDGDESWSATASNSGVIQGETSVEKTADGIGERTEDYFPLFWTNTIIYSDAVNKTAYEHSDRIAPAEIRRGTVWDRASYADDHYGIATEIYASIVDTLELTVQNDDGTTETISFAEASARGTVTVEFAKLESGNDSRDVGYTDSETHVKSCYITFGGGLKPLAVKYSYNTRFSTEHYATGTQWRFMNRLGAETKWSEPRQYLTEEVPAGGSVSKQLWLWGEVWTEAGRTIDYDYTDDGKKRDEADKGVLTYRLLATPAEGSTTMTVTDQLPEGVSLVAGSVKAGSYRANTNDSIYTWTDNADFGYTYDADARLITFTFENLGTSLAYVADSQVAVISYQVKVDEDFATLEGAEISSDGSSFTATKDFTNLATNGDATDDITVTMTRTQQVLVKEGKQVTQGGAYTSRVHYTVQVNPDALDLLEGSDTLELTDTFSSDRLDLALDAQSITLTDAATGEVVAPQSLHVNQPEETTSGEYTGTTQSFIIGVADGTAYVLEYDVIADKQDGASAPTSGEFYNEIVLEGFAQGDVTVTVQGLNVRASSNHAGMTLVKVDENNNTVYLEATFALDKYNPATGEFESVQTFTTAVDPQNPGFNFDYFGMDCALLGNTLYRITEVTQPEGYELDETPFHFIVKGNIEDVRSGTIASTELTATTDDEAKALAGAPEGLEIELLDATDDSYFEITNALLPEPEPEPVRIAKVDANTGEELDGAHLQILDKDGTVVFEWDSVAGEPQVIEGLAAGIYTLRETSAPEGYMVCEDATFELAEDGSVSGYENISEDADGNLVLLVKNTPEEQEDPKEPEDPKDPEKPEVPKTNDPTRTSVLAMMFVSAAGMGLLIRRRVRE